MNTGVIHNSTILRPSARLLATVRDELRERRVARTNRRTLERELATFDTPAQINDLLGSMRGQDEAAAETVRSIILHNSARQNLNRFAS
jgi:hypothetical protein